MNLKIGQTWNTRGIGRVDVITVGLHRSMVGCGQQVYAVHTSSGGAIFNDSKGSLTSRVERVYIAGPMTGLPELNFPAFMAAAADYRRRGCHVENPAEINPDPLADWHDCMKRDIPRLLTCDTIVLLPGWGQSRGAKIEYDLAHALGMAIVYRA